MTSRTRTRVLTALLTLVLLPLALELVLRSWFEPGPPPARPFRFAGIDHDGEGTAMYRTHPRHFYEVAPRHRHAPPHLGMYATWDWPHRGIPAEPAPLGLTRVAVLGDSCAYGACLRHAETLSVRIAEHLDARGIDAARVQVLNFGVPGYSTVQIGSMLEHVLERYAPRVVVLYAGAWNDQGPALGENDVALRARRRETPVRDPLGLRNTAIHAWLATLVPRDEGPTLLDVDEVRRLWSGGEPPYGYRVPEDALADELAAHYARCREHGAEPIAIVPPHPPTTLRDHPRTGRDAACVRATAMRHGVPHVDAPALVSMTEETQGTYFTDFVHPSPTTVERIAAAVAELVVQIAERDAWPACATFAIRSVSPDVIPELGDVRVRVELDRELGSGAPALAIGGAPLGDVRRVAERTWEGTMMANAAGRHDVVCRSHEGVAFLRDHVVIEPPRFLLERTPAGRWRVGFSSRPGDRARVMLATRRAAVPQWNGPLAHELPSEERVDLDVVLEAGADGRGFADLPESTQTPTQTLHVQLIVLPAGLEPGSGAEILSPVFTIPP